MNGMIEWVRVDFFIWKINITTTVSYCVNIILLSMYIYIDTYGSIHSLLERYTGTYAVIREKFMTT